MAKFDNVLLLSDYDNTLVYTAKLFEGGSFDVSLCKKNRDKIQYFMDNGGTFCLVSGRTWQLMKSFYEGIPTNGPCGIGNGAAVFDPKTMTFLYENFITSEAAEHIAEVADAFPHVTVELMSAGHETYAYRPCILTDRHAQGAQYIYKEVAAIKDADFPLIKVLFEGDPEELLAVEKYINSRPWIEHYETVFSGKFLLEFIARGANKGAMVREMARLLGKDPAHVYCVGDHLNDIPMLKAAREGFCPANAEEEVKAIATAVCHCEDGAVGEVIDILDKRY